MKEKVLKSNRLNQKRNLNLAETWSSGQIFKLSQTRLNLAASPIYYLHRYKQTD